MLSSCIWLQFTRSTFVFACLVLGSDLISCLRVSVCTFLGPSRKLGPPKGYIDAIEARLHQTEALLGILLAADDIRAKGLLDDLREVSVDHSKKLFCISILGACIECTFLDCATTGFT